MLDSRDNGGFPPTDCSTISFATLLSRQRELGHDSDNAGLHAAPHHAVFGDRLMPPVQAICRHNVEHPEVADRLFARE